MQDNSDRRMRDKRGVMELPLKLTVIMIILMISIPLITEMVETNERYMMDSAMSQEAVRIGDAVKAAYYSGTGSSRVVDVSIPEGCEMVLGGDSSDGFAITCLYEGKVLSKTYMERPAVRFDSPVTLTGNARLELAISVKDGFSCTEVVLL